MKDTQVQMYPHSEAKVKLLRLYLERYLNILTQTPYVSDIYVFDLFCGEGLYDGGGKGSPIVILETINKIHDESVASKGKTGHFYCLFNDKVEEKVDKLSTIVAQKGLFKPEMGKLLYTKMDFRSLLPKVIAKLNSLKKEKAFIFIDPYGYKDIKVADLQTLLACSKSEVLLFLPTQFMFRFESRATPESLKDFIDELVPQNEWPKSETGIDFIESLRDAFRKALGSTVYVDTFIITRDLNQFFCLFFFTSHIYGFDRMLDAKWKIDEEEGRGWSYEAPSLFNEQPKKPNILKFERNMRFFLSESFKSNGEIYDFTLHQGHLPSHANDVLRMAQQEGRLEALEKNGDSFNGRSFFVNYKSYRDENDKIRIKIKSNGSI